MGYYFIAVGAIISAFAGWAFFSRLRLLFVSEPARGVIVDFDEKLRFVGQTKRIYCHPTVEFEPSEVQTFTFTYGDRAVGGVGQQRFQPRANGLLHAVDHRR